MSSPDDGFTWLSGGGKEPRDVPAFNMFTENVGAVITPYSTLEAAKATDEWVGTTDPENVLMEVRR